MHSGTRIGPYEIAASLGAGGMGEVFRARDTRLNRDVAIKVLPKGFVSDADRLRRFEQEAKTLAALNHPNILTIHDAGVHDGAPYLVSELLEGRTLREERSGAALPVRKATDYALQLAHGLAAAHSKGIIHRDLKPENIFITKDGRVKILDFGLAKLKVGTRSAASQMEKVRDVVESVPTIRIDADAIINTTEPGLVLGTPSYMSPEQVRGEPADHRADIFAFGAVLYEMLSGTRAFRRDTPVATMNAVLSEEPPELSATTATIPLALDRVVGRCLEKQPQNRFQSVNDLAFAIENAGALSNRDVQGEHRSGTSRAALAASFVTGLVLATITTWLVWTKLVPGKAPSSSPSITPLRKFELHLTTPARRIGTGDELQPAISPDGQKLVYATADGLWLRWLNSTAPATRLIAGENILCPFWSPDSQEVGYFEERKVMRVAIQEKRPRLICTTPDDAWGPAGGAWLTKDRIVFGTGWASLYEVSSEGGTITTLDRTSGEEIKFHNPSALPEGRGVLLSVHRTVSIDTIALWTPVGGRKVLLQITNSICFYPVFSPSGHVVFQRSDDAGGIWAFPFSLEKLERIGEPFRVSDFGTIPTVSRDGTLVFGLFTLDEFGRRQLAWVDRTGKLLGTFGPALPGMGQQRLSPDGRSVVLASGETISALDILTVDVASGRASVLARDPEMEALPFWLREEGKIVFTRRNGSTSRALLKAANATGEEEVLFDNLRAQTGSAASTAHLSRSGNYFFAARTSTSGHTTVGYFLLSDREKKFVPLPATYQNTTAWSLSADDRLLAYQSGESGRIEIYVVDFPGLTGRTPVSRDGGRHPVWDTKGAELFYLDMTGRTLWSAKLKPDHRTFDEPAKVFHVPKTIHPGFVWWPSFYDVAPDGERFLMLQTVEDEAPAQSLRPNVLVVQNWFEEFRGK